MSIRKRGSLRIQEAILKFERNKRGLPRQLGNIAKNHFLMSFRKGGFTDRRFRKWEPRRKRLGKGRTSNTLKERANLQLRGALRRSVQVRAATFRRIRIATDGIIYDKIHNEGLRGRAFGKHDFTMPERKFMGNSAVLERKLEQRIIREIDKIF